MSDERECTICPSFVVRCAHFGEDIVAMVKREDRDRLEQWWQRTGRTRTQPDTVLSGRNEADASFEVGSIEMVEAAPS